MCPHNVLLVGPSKKTSSVANWSAPHIGLHRLAAWLRAEIPGIRVDVHDPCKDGMPGDDLFEHRTTIGFSPLSETLASDIALINQASRANPGADLVVGGVEATLNYQEILDKSPVQWVVLGTGERALAGIVQGEAPEDIPGIIYRRWNNPTLNSDLWDFYEQLDFSVMGYEDYWQQTARLYAKPNYRDIRTVRLVTSTHCNRGCAFCSVTQWQRLAVGRLTKPAMLNAEQLLSLCARVKREVPETETIYFCEDDFCHSRERVEHFCEKSASLGLSYLVQTHSSRVDLDLVRTLARGGARHLTLGIENASKNVLASFNKPQDLARIPDIIWWCEDNRITPYLLIILFAPSATVADLQENVSAVLEWARMGATISVEPYTMPYRGAPLYESAHEFGWCVTEIEGTDLKIKQPTVILPDDLQVRAIMLAFNRMWPAYRDKHAPSHSFKGTTGILMVGLLQEILADPPPVAAGSGAATWQQITSDRQAKEVSP